MSILESGDKFLVHDLGPGLYHIMLSGPFAYILYNILPKGADTQNSVLSLFMTISNYLLRLFLLYPGLSVRTRSCIHVMSIYYVQNTSHLSVPLTCELQVQ